MYIAHYYEPNNVTRFITIYLTLTQKNKNMRNYKCFMLLEHEMVIKRFYYVIFVS